MTDFTLLSAVSMTTRIWVWSGVWSSWDCSSCWTLPRELSVASLTGIHDRFSLRVYPPATRLADLGGGISTMTDVFSSGGHSDDTGWITLWLRKGIDHVELA